MNKIDIDVFFEIVKKGSIQQAATTLFMSSSAVSQRLNILENELGIQLFERGKGIKETILTTQGKEFYKIALDIKFNFEQSLSLKEQTSHPYISIASVDSLIADVLMPLYEKLIYSPPYFKMHLRCYHSDNIYPKVETHNVDMGFALFDLKRTNIKVKPILSDDMVLIVSPHSKITDKTIHTDMLNPYKEISLGLREEIYMGWGPKFREWHTKWFDNTIIPMVSASSLHWSSLFFKGGDFWSIVPRCNAIGMKKIYGVNIIELKNPPEARTCFQLVNEKQTSVTARNIELFNSYLYTHINDLSKEGNIKNLL